MYPNAVPPAPETTTEGGAEPLHPVHAGKKGIDVEVSEWRADTESPAETRTHGFDWLESQAAVFRGKVSNRRLGVETLALSMMRKESRYWKLAWDSRVVREKGPDT